MMVRDFMTRPVIALGPEASVAEAAKLMLQHRISGLPVVDSAHKLVGIVSEHDLLRRGEDAAGRNKRHWLHLMIDRAGLAEESNHFHDRKVSDVMTSNPITVYPTTSLSEACRVIVQHCIKRLPVVESGDLVGIIARTDFMRALAQAGDGKRAQALGDDSVNECLSELERESLRRRARAPKAF
jgi:CBS domain-containing protein